MAAARCRSAQAQPTPASPSAAPRSKRRPALQQVLKTGRSRRRSSAVRVDATISASAPPTSWKYQRMPAQIAPATAASTPGPRAASSRPPLRISRPPTSAALRLNCGEISATPPSTSNAITIAPRPVASAAPTFPPSEFSASDTPPSGCLGAQGPRDPPGRRQQCQHPRAASCLHPIRTPQRQRERRAQTCQDQTNQVHAPPNAPITASRCAAFGASASDTQTANSVAIPIKASPASGVRSALSQRPRRRSGGVRRVDRFRAMPNPPARRPEPPHFPPEAPNASPQTSTATGITIGRWRDSR